MSTYTPTVEFRDEDNEADILAIVAGSEDTASNEIYIRARYEDYSETPNVTISGDGEIVITLGSPDFYYAKLISKRNPGDTDEDSYTSSEVILEIKSIVDSADEAEGGVKNIKNVDVQSVTNTFFGNQFLGYFLKIPQVGYYQDMDTKALKPYVTDRINESIRGLQLPETAIPMMPIPFYAHQNEQYMGVGDGELGQISIRFKLDRFLQNYCSLLNWSYLKYDWTFGAKNPANQMDDRDIRGTFVVEFLDEEEKRTRKLAYKIVIDTLPGLPLGVETPDDLEFEALFRVLDIDTSQFVMGEPLSERVRIF